MSPSQIVVRPNASLSHHQAAWILGGMSAISFTIAGTLAALGYWIVLPFAGLEMSYLAAGLYLALRDNGYREVIRCDAGQLHIEKGHGRPESTWHCPLAWARSHYQPPTGPTAHGKVLITYAGQSIEVGKILADDDKPNFARNLQQWLSQTQQVARQPEIGP
jgi:uncharacterized membrane protein